MNNIHLVTPFSRPHLKNILLQFYRRMEIIWHPIMFIDQITVFTEDWVSPLIIPMEEKDSAGSIAPYFKVNYFVEHYRIEDEDYYCCVSDDDMFEDGVLKKIKDMDDDVVVISMKRGDNILSGLPLAQQHPTTTLFADSSNMVVYKVGWEQIFMKGRIFKNHLFNDSSIFADGEMAMALKKFYQIRYEKNLFALFNYFEPGRWNNQ